MIEVIGELPAKHERVNDYEPKEPTADELKLAGVTLNGANDTSVALTCDHCGQWWAPLWARGQKPPDGYWICPNARKVE